MIRSVIADDEALDRQKLRQVLHGIGNVDIVAECSTIQETINATRVMNPDLLFLDIPLSTINGMDVVDGLSSLPAEKRPHVVFVAADDRYAVRAFEISAIDYVLKPYTVERLRLAVNRVRERQASRTTNTLGNSRAIEPNVDGRATSERFAKRLVLKSRGRILFLPMNEIRWIEAEQNYVRIRTTSESHMLRETIGRLEGRLDPRTFLRVHRSNIVNLHFIKEIKNEPGGEAWVMLGNGEKIRMSRGCRWSIHKLVHWLANNPPLGIVCRSSTMP